MAGERALYAPDLDMLACGDKGDMPIRDGVSIRHWASARVDIPRARRGGVGRRHVQQSVVMYVVSSRIGDECMQPRCMYVSGVLFRFRHVCGTLGHLDLASGPVLFVSFET